MSSKKIGLYGGTFDPIHLGHINLALRLLETCHLDEILFCPVHTSPFKKDAPPLSSKEDRLEMLRLGLKDLPNMDITNVELDRDPPSYMIDTIKQLNSSRPGQYFLLFANDQLAKLHLWKDYEELVRLAPPLIGRREKQDIQLDSSISDAVSEIIRRGIYQIPILDVSSTEIRERIGKNMYCGHLVEAKVLDYIYSHDLYSLSN